MDVRVVLWTCLVMTAIMACTHTLFLPMLFSIIVMGIIPGTSLKIPTAIMLVVYPSLFLIGTYWLSTVQILFNETAPAAKPSPQRTVRKKAPSTTKSLARAKSRARVAV